MNRKELRREIQGERLSSNEKFLKRLNEITDANLGDENFGVSELAEDLDMSRMQVYRKVRRVTGKNASEFIREKRLQYARELLLRDVGTVSEIAYRSGFGSPAYFNNCYRNYYGHTPGQAREFPTENDRDENGLNAVPDKKRNRLLYRTILPVLGLLIIGFFTFQLLTKGGAKNNMTLSSGINQKSIAVLPFYNDSPDTLNEYFCNGMMDEILDRLQKISSLKVKSRSSVEKYLAEDRDIKQIGNELNASFLVEGSVRKSGEDIRITAWLIDAISGDRLWSEIYDGKLTDKLFQFQGNIARRIASSLNAVITPQEKNRIDRMPTENMEAYDLSLRGWQMLKDFDFTFDSTYLNTARNLFNEALTYDSTYSETLAGKGSYFMRSGQNDSAIYYFDKQISTNPDESVGYIGKGNVYWIGLGQLDSALKYLSKAQELDPDKIWLNLSLGQVFWYKNELIKSLHYFQKANELNFDSLPTITNSIGLMFLDIGDYSKAEKYFKESFNLDPKCLNISFLTRTFLAQGKFDMALHFLDSICVISHCTSECYRERFRIFFSRKDYKEAELFYDEDMDETVAGQSIYDIPFMDQISRAWIYLKTGRKEKAIKILENTIHEDEELLKTDPAWPDIRYLRLAAVYAIRGENEISLKYLEKLGKIRFSYGWHDYIEHYPPFEQLKSDPAFKAIIKRSHEKKAAYRAQIKKMEERGDLNL